MAKEIMQKVFTQDQTYQCLIAHYVNFTKGEVYYCPQDEGLFDDGAKFCKPDPNHFEMVNIKEIPSRFKKGSFYTCLDPKGIEGSFCEGEVYRAFNSKAIFDDLGRIIYSTKGSFEEIPHKQGLKASADLSENDPINPDHYKSFSVETIDMMIAIYGREKVAIHCELTAFKYRMRAGKKDDINQDLKKEAWYLDKAKELRNV